MAGNLVVKVKPLTDLLDQLMRKYSVPGLQFAMYDRGEVTRIDVEWDEPIRAYVPELTKSPDSLVSSANSASC